MEELNGCQYCGQVLLEDGGCDCIEAQKQKKKQNGLCLLDRKIKELTNEENEAEKEIISLMALAVYDERIEACTIKTPEGIVFKFNIDAKEI